MMATALSMKPVQVRRAAASSKRRAINQTQLRPEHSALAKAFAKYLPLVPRTAKDATSILELISSQARCSA